MMLLVFTAVLIVLSFLSVQADETGNVPKNNVPARAVQNQFDVIHRTASKKATIVSSITFSPKNYADKSLLTLILPIPRSSYYQNINKGKVSSSSNGNWKIMTHPETGEKYAAGIFENIHAPAELTLRFDAEMFDVSVDFTKIQKIYHYKNKNPIYITYTDGTDKLHPLIQEASQKIRKDASVTNDLEYVIAAMRYVHKRMTYKCPFDHSGSIDDILKYANGDCGCHSKVFNALLRAGGIPARMVYGVDPFNSNILQGEPNEKRRHAWSEFYLEKYGWLPADATASRFGQSTFICTSYGVEDITVLGSASGTLQPQKISHLQCYSSLLWYDEKMEFKQLFRFEPAMK